MRGREVDVGEEDGGPPAVDRRFLADQRAQPVIAGDDRDDDDQRRRRDDAPGTTSVKATDGCLPCRLVLTQQQPGDHEPGDHKEDVDSDVAAGDTRMPA